MSNSGKPSALKWLVLAVIFVAAAIALVWLSGFAHFFIDMIVRIIRFCVGSVDWLRRS